MRISPRWQIIILNRFDITRLINVDQRFNTCWLAARLVPLAVPPSLPYHAYLSTVDKLSTLVTFPTSLPHYPPATHHRLFRRLPTPVIESSDFSIVSALAHSCLQGRHQWPVTAARPLRLPKPPPAKKKLPQRGVCSPAAAEARTTTCRTISRASIPVAARHYFRLHSSRRRIRQHSFLIRRPATLRRRTVPRGSFDVLLARVEALGDGVL